MNSLHNEKASQWIDDKSNNESTLHSSIVSNDDHQDIKHEITLASGRKGTPFNIMLQPSPPSSPSNTDDNDLYFEITIIELNGHIAIGFATPSEFKPGWSTKGMFYNGNNITNGSAALIVGFGPPQKRGSISNGDVIGVHLKQRKKEGTLSVVFYHNGQCLGTAFHLKSSAEAALSSFRPCLHVDGKAIVAYVAPGLMPTTSSRNVFSTNDLTSFAGEWRIKQCFRGPELGEYKLPSTVKCILSIQNPSTSRGVLPRGGGRGGFRGRPDVRSTAQEGDDSNKYDLSIKVGNMMRATIGTMEQEVDSEGFTKIQIGPIMSTEMMPPPDEYEVENFLSASLPVLQKMIVDENGNLILNGPTCEIICSPHVKEFDALMHYH